MSKERDQRTARLHHDKGEAPLELLGLFLDRRDHFLGSLHPFLRACVEHEVKERLHTVFALQSGRAFAVSDGSRPLDDFGELFLVEVAAARVFGWAAARVWIAHGVPLTADDVDWRGGTVLLQFAHPLALDALERRQAGEIEADDDSIAAFVGESAMVRVLGRGHRVLHGDVTGAFARLEVGLVEVERLSRAHAVDKEVLSELDGECRLSASIIADKDDSLLAAVRRHLVQLIGRERF